METQTVIDKSREFFDAYRLTLGLYIETKSTLGQGKKNLDLGYSVGRTVKVCPVDFVVDVEKAVARILPSLSHIEKLYLKASYEDSLEAAEWLLFNLSSVEFDAVSLSTQKKVAEEFIRCGIHPLSDYVTPTEVR